MAASSRNAAQTAVSDIARPPRWHRRETLAWLAAAGLCGWSRPAAGQDDPVADLPPPEDFTLRAKDGVNLELTYYPGGDTQETVPVILLHQLGGSRLDMEPLALYLQAAGHAVLSPDLRGHGGSISVEGVDLQLDFSKMNAQQFARMVTDMEKLKGWFLKKHNAGLLNIDRLSLVGVELGALVACNWGVADWSWPILATGKQGQDVKAVALISPPFQVKGLRMQIPLAHEAFRQAVSFLIAYGADDADARKDATKIYNLLERYHPLPPEDRRAKEQDLFEVAMETQLQGAELLNEPSLNLMPLIGEFIQARAVNPSYPWKERRNPLD